MKKIIFILFLLLAQNLGIAKEEPKTILSAQIENTRFLDGATELILASYKGDSIAVQKLLKIGFNPDEKYRAVSPIFVAVHYKHSDIVKILLKNGANPNTKCLYETILNYAILKEDEKSVSHLLNSGAATDNRTSKLVKKTKNKEIKKLFKQ